MCITLVYTALTLRTKKGAKAPFLVSNTLTVVRQLSGRVHSRLAYGHGRALTLQQ